MNKRARHVEPWCTVADEAGQLNPGACACVIYVNVTQLCLCLCLCWCPGALYLAACSQPPLFHWSFP